MKRKEAALVFKPYVMNQISLKPSSYEELVAEKHLVRTVNRGYREDRSNSALKAVQGRGEPAAITRR